MEHSASSVPVVTKNATQSPSSPLKPQALRDLRMRAPFATETCGFGNKQFAYQMLPRVFVEIVLILQEVRRKVVFLMQIGRLVVQARSDATISLVTAIKLEIK